MLGVAVPPEYGGPGADPLAVLVVSEELGRSPAGATRGSCLNSDMCTLDRLQICARSQGAAEAAFALTLDYVRQRRIFGRRLIDFQNTQFKLADVETDIALGRALLSEAIRKYRAGELTERDSSILKIFLPEMEFRVLDTCLQFWGGSGFMHESTIARMFTAARVQRIYAGATELQKALLARSYVAS